MDLVEMLFNNAMNAEGGGGGGVTFPVFTYDEATETIICNMTYEEMANCYTQNRDNNSFIPIKYHDNGDVTGHGNGAWVCATPVDGDTMREHCEGVPDTVTNGFAMQYFDEEPIFAYGDDSIVYYPKQ